MRVLLRTLLATSAFALLSSLVIGPLAVQELSTISLTIVLIRSE